MTKDRQNPDQLEQRGPNDEQNNAVKRMLLPRSALLYRTAVSESSRSVLTERVTKLLSAPTALLKAIREINQELSSHTNIHSIFNGRATSHHELSQLPFKGSISAIFSMCH
jgi:hypothetical protein